MKDKILSVVQKTAVLFLSFLLLLTMLPVGLLPGSDSPSAEGSFIKKMPSDEICIQSESKEQAVRNIGKDNYICYKFDISELLKIKESEIKEITLRLSFLKGSGMRVNTVTVSAVDFDKAKNYSNIFDVFAKKEKVLKILHPDTSGEEDALEEIDVSEYVKEALQNKMSTVSVRVSSEMPICIAMASQHYIDEAYRPCLKIVTGIAEDSDADTLVKAETVETAFVSENLKNTSGSRLAEAEGGLLIGGGNEAYLKFNINKAAVTGELYSARLILKNVTCNNGADIELYLLNNSEWTADNISYVSKPRGEESKAASLTTDEGGTVTVDVTQQICEAVKNNIYTLTFRIEGDEDEIIRINNGEREKPALCLKSSDDKNIVCAAEAALNALGKNRASFVTMNLERGYSSNNGKSAKISWNEAKADGESESESTYIDENGEVTRPKWYEDGVKIEANAEIRSGDYVANRRFYLKIPAESAPDYSKYKFSNFVDIGDSQSEKDQKVEYKNVGSARKKWFGGHLLSYRNLRNGSVMLLNFACSPYEVNYITFKIRTENTEADELTIVPYNHTGEERVYTVPAEAKTADGGFLLVTYALPKEFTEEKSSIGLRVGFNCLSEESVSEFYAAYMTQNPFFEPKQFESRGESFAGGISLASEAISKFTAGLKTLFVTESDNGEAEREEAEVSGETENVIADAETVVFSGEDINIAFKINSEDSGMSIYQITEYFTRYCDNCPMKEEDGVISVKFGPHILLWNISDDTKNAVSLPMEFSGVYRMLPNGGYYNFSEEGKLIDDSAVPSDKNMLDGKEAVVLPKKAVILSHISDPLNSSDWRVSSVNGRSIAEIIFDGTEKIEEIKVKSVGGKADGAEKLTVVLMLYEDGKVIAAEKKEIDLYEELYEYGVDFSDDGLYMKKERTLKIFVYDNTEKANTVLPKAELPQTDK